MSVTHRFTRYFSSPKGLVLRAEGLSPAARDAPTVRRRAEALGSRYEDRLRGLSVERCINGFHLNAASY